MNDRSRGPGFWQELRSVFDAVDPVPPEVSSVAYAAMTFRTLDAELGRLVWDSAEMTSAGVRDAEGPGRLVTFESGSLTIEVQVSGSGTERHLLGQLVPPGPARVIIQSPARSIEVDADDLGRFSASHVRAGPVRLKMRRAAGPETVTSWLMI